MSILSDFEERVGGMLEGAFASVFRSPVQPSEIAKALGRAMDDGRAVGVGKVYAPVSYVVALSPEDTDNFGAFTSTLAGELSTFLADHAREHLYHLTSKPLIAFVEHDDLKLGRFRVSAELAFAGEAEADAPFAATSVYDQDAGDAPVPAGSSSSASSPATPGLATVTVGDTSHDVALHGQRVVVGRLSVCDICLADANVSRRHAAFVRHGESWHIEDLDSTNGTLLNGRPVADEPLRDGDTVEIGLTRLTYHMLGG